MSRPIARVRRAMLALIANEDLKQADIAFAYAWAMNCPADPAESDWSAINGAIIDRWSIEGLRSVKEAAWRMVEATRQSFAQKAERAKETA